MLNTRNRAGKSLITSSLQYLGATSPTLQRVVIHLLQPLLVSSIVYLWITLYEAPIWFTLLGCLVLLLVIRSRYLQKHSNSHLSSENEVHPVNTASSEMPKQFNTEDQQTPKSTNTANSSRLIAHLDVANLCEEKSDPDCPSEPEKMSIDDRSSLEPPEDSYDSSLEFPDDSRVSLDSCTHSCEHKGKFHPPRPTTMALRRKYSDNSLSGSVLSSIDSPMEFSDPDYDSRSNEEEDSDSFT